MSGRRVCERRDGAARPGAASQWRRVIAHEQFVNAAGLGPAGARALAHATRAGPGPLARLSGCVVAGRAGETLEQLTNLKIDLPRTTQQVPPAETLQCSAQVSLADLNTLRARRASRARTLATAWARGSARHGAAQIRAGDLIEAAAHICSGTRLLFTRRHSSGRKRHQRRDVGVGGERLALATSRRGRPHKRSGRARVAGRAGPRSHTQLGPVGGFRRRPATMVAHWPTRAAHRQLLDSSRTRPSARGGSRRLAAH